MAKDVEELNVARANRRAFLGSGIGQYALIYACLALVASGFPTWMKISGVIAGFVLTFAYQAISIRVIRVSDDVIDELNAQLMDEILRYCSEKYTTNDRNEALKFFYSTNDDESELYLNACLVDKDGKDVEGTQVTLVNMWRFKKTEEFMRHPKKFLVDQKDSLVASTKEAINEFFARFKDVLNRGGEKK